MFQRRRAVCAGYANLLAALGKVTGDDIRVVTGDARTDGSDLTGEGHAWNAARIGDALGPDRRHLGRRQRHRERLREGVRHRLPVRAARDPGRHALPRGPALAAARAGAHARRVLPPAGAAAALLRRGVLARVARPLAGHGRGRGRGRALEPARPVRSGEDHARGGGRRDRSARSPTTGRTRACAASSPEEGSYRLRLYSNRQQYGRYQGLAELFVQNRAD